MKTVSLIRESLWNKADWQGLGFVAFPASPPILALIFGKRDPAKRIFSFWEEELGKIDEADSLRICIIRHVDKRNPHHYRVVIGSNIEQANVGKSDAFFAVSRIHTMTPDSSQNLDSFLHAYGHFGAYFVAPAVVDSSGQYPESIGDLSLQKSELIVREAWEIGSNDLDGVGILPDDQPILPDGISDPPVNELLEWKRRNMREDNGNQPIPKPASRQEKRKKDKRKRKKSRNSRKGK